jgi:hypothetical protein
MSELIDENEEPKTLQELYADENVIYGDSSTKLPKITQNLIEIALSKSI